MESLSKNKFVVLVFAVYLLIVFWSISLYKLGLRDSSLNYLINVGYSTLFFASTILLASGLGSVADFYKRRSILFFGLACTSFGIGLVIWASYNIILKVEIPFPSVGDIFFLADYLLAFMGAYYYLLSLKVPINKLFIFDSGVILVQWIIVISAIFNFIIKPESKNLLAQIINTVYPLGSSLLVAMAVIALRINISKTKLPLTFLILAFISSTIADILFSYRTNVGAYWNGDISDVMFATKALFYFLAISKMIENNAVETTPDQPQVPSASSLA